jgi:hypothetical protein
MNTKALRRKKHSSADLVLLRRSLKISRKLAKCGLSTRSYSLASPYQNRLIRTTPAEILAMSDDCF